MSLAQQLAQTFAGAAEKEADTYRGCASACSLSDDTKKASEKRTVREAAVVLRQWGETGAEKTLLKLLASR